MVEQESDCRGARIFGKVAQVHKRALCEECEIEITKPYEESLAGWLIDARELDQCLSAT